MEVTRYIYQSPSSSAVQVGRPDPQSSSPENDANEVVGSLSKAASPSLEQSQSSTPASTLTSVNVAASSTDASLSASLDTFSSLNAQVQGNAVYSDS